MAAYELSIKATSLADMEGAIADLHARFSAVAEDVPQGKDEAPRRGRRRVVGSLASTARQTAADEVPGAEGAGEGPAAGDPEGTGGGDAEAVEPAQAAEGQVEDQEAEAGQEAAADGPSPSGNPQAGPPARDGEGAEDSADGPTVDTVKSAFTKLIAQPSGYERAQKILKEQGFAKPGRCPAEKLVPVMAALRAELEKGG